MLSKIVTDPIDVNEAFAHVRHPSCGAVASFEGNIREENQGKRVLSFYYEAYEKLFHNIAEQLFAECQARWDVRNLAVIQRIGNLQVGDVGIVIAASSPHKRDALEAAAYYIEQFKTRAPVWKKETTEDDVEWINWPKKLRDTAETIKE